MNRKSPGVLICEIREVMGKAWSLDPETIPEDASFNEFYPWDSMAHVTLLLALEEKYKIEISAEIIAHLISMKTIVEYIEKNNNE
jgi:acyl carrier protein